VRRAHRNRAQLVTCTPHHLPELIGTGVQSTGFHHHRQGSGPRGFQFPLQFIRRGLHELLLAAKRGQF